MAKYDGKAFVSQKRHRVDGVDHRWIPNDGKCPLSWRTPYFENKVVDRRVTDLVIWMTNDEDSEWISDKWCNEIDIYHYSDLDAQFYGI